MQEFQCFVFLVGFGVFMNVCIIMSSVVLELDKVKRLMNGISLAINYITNIYN